MAEHIRRFHSAPVLQSHEQPIGPPKGRSAGWYMRLRTRANRPAAEHLASVRRGVPDPLRCFATGGTGTHKGGSAPMHQKRGQGGRGACGWHRTTETVMDTCQRVIVGD